MPPPQLEYRPMKDWGMPVDRRKPLGTSTIEVKQIQMCLYVQDSGDGTTRYIWWPCQDANRAEAGVWQDIGYWGWDPNGQKPPPRSPKKMWMCPYYDPHLSQPGYVWVPAVSPKQAGAARIGLKYWGRPAPTPPPRGS